MTFPVRGFTSVNAECHSTLSKQGVSQQSSQGLQANSLLVYTPGDAVSLGGSQHLPCPLRTGFWLSVPFSELKIDPCGPSTQLGVWGESVLQSPAVPTSSSLSFLNQEAATLFSVPAELAESSPQRDQPSNFQLLPPPAGFRPAFPSRCHLPADKREEKGKTEK